jgi:glycosyltransferase involved in cell wall biosynthesis
MRYTLFHLDSERGFRGGERQLLYLARTMRDRGHGNVIVCRRGEALERAAIREGFDTLALPFFGEWDPLSAWRLRRAAALAEGTPILHAHTGHTAALAFLASRFNGPAWIVHRRVDFHLSGRLSRRFKYDASSKIAAVSEEIRRILLEDGVASSRVAVVHDMIPVGEEGSPFGPAAPDERERIRRDLSGPLGLDPKGTWIGNMAAHVPHKDQATLLRAAAVAGRERPELRFLLVGDGPEHGRLKALARELGIEALVRFPGRTSDPKPWLQAFDLYAHSSWGEGMGSVLLEVAQTGVPIVATNAGGIPEVVSDGESARLVPARDPEALGRAILETLADPEGARRRADAARESLGRFSLRSIGDKTEALYREVADAA